MTNASYAEFDEFEASLYGVNGRYMLRSAQRRDWRLRVLELNGVALMAGQEGAATIYSGAGMPGCFNLFLPLSGHECTVVDGRRFDRRAIGWMAPDRMFHIDASRPASWMTISMPCELVCRWMATYADNADLSLLARNLVLTGGPSLGALLALTQRLLFIDDRQPAQLHHPAGEQTARSELLRLAFNTLLPLAARSTDTARHQNHRRILSQAMDLLAAARHTPILLEDLCAATSASERTIRNVFNRYVGISPHRYLVLHRLHHARQALKHAKAGETVTSICMRFGVWDIGRFAMQYRRLFGVLPSQTLRASHLGMQAPH